MDDGVIKYQQDFEPGPAPSVDEIGALIAARNELWQLALIGEDPIYKVGYGNISMRKAGQRQFWISGTQTGHIAQAGPRDFTEVVDYSIPRNWLRAVGPMKASSEALTHAAVYEAAPDCTGIVHIHHKRSWQTLMDQGFPTTRSTIPYGTPEMAAEIGRLFTEAELGTRRILAMAGHDDGVIAFADTLPEAMDLLLSTLKKLGCLDPQN